MFEYWEMNVHFEEDPAALLIRLGDELMDTWESQDHILFEIRNYTVKSTWEYRNRLRNTHTDADEHSDFIDAIYSGSLDKFFGFFFGDDYEWRKLSYQSEYCLTFIEESGYVDEDVPAGISEIEDFFSKFCTPNKTYVELHNGDNGGLPCRYYLMRNKEGDVYWDFQSCEVSWPERSK